MNGNGADADSGIGSSEGESSETGGSEGELSLDEMHSLLGNRQRRDLLRYLVETGETPVSVEACAVDLVTQDVDGSEEMADADRIAITLEHVHLPRLAKHGIVEWDEAADSVALGPAFEEIRPVLELMEDLEESRQQTERLDRFAKVVTHDLRSPLLIANGHLELARSEVDSEHLEEVQRALDRMETLLEDLQTIARSERQIGEMRPVDLATLAADSWRNVETAGATLVTDTDRSILADADRLQQLLENLFRNAVEHGTTGPASDEHGDALEEGDDEVTITVGELDAGDGFYVVDDGPGIPSELQQRVFENGFSTTDAGTGLGLNIVQRIAIAHGWSVGVTTGEAGGARFEITGVEYAD